MVRDSVSVLRAFEHLIELLVDEASDSEIIAIVESAKEMFEEELCDVESDDDL